MLEVFRNFEISGDQSKLTTFLSQFSRALPAGWKRDPAREKEVRDISGDTRTFVFRINAGDDRPGARLFLMRRGRLLRVSNVVPLEFGQLSKSQYNSFIDELSHVALPIAQRLDLKVTVTSAQLDVSELLNADTFRALKAFSGAANRTTGSTHPLDRRRWLTFLILEHIQHSRLDGDILTRWFIEEEKWPDTEAYELGSQFEFARELLTAYDGRT